MRVLIASHSLEGAGGVQVYERDLALWLLDRGHSPIAYSTMLGDTARLLERRTVPVVDDLARVAVPPDIIHGDSAAETMTALLRFPSTPAVLLCHGWLGSTGIAPRFPRIRRYVAVDDTCADRLLLREGIPAEKVSVLLNAVDLSRFKQRAPLPEKPRRAIVFSNTAHELTHLPMIREACRSASITVDVAGEYSGTAVSEPETILGNYDLAFAKAKAALEAMACGLAVILCDSAGLGGMVRSDDLDRLRRLNFGMRALSRRVTAESVREEIDRYDAIDARSVSDRIRSIASSDMLHEALLAMYEDVIDEQAHDLNRPDASEESLAVSEFLRRLTLAQRADKMVHGSLYQALQRLLTTPLVGPAMTRTAQWFIRRSDRR